MAKLKWDEVGEREYETGVDHVVLYPMTDSGTYGDGVAWNGVTQIDKNPSGGDSSPLYADNIEYLNLQSAEKHSGTINAYMFPDEFEACDGSAELVDGFEGITVGQQPRKSFGLCYRSLKGNDTKGEDYGYKLYIVYGCKASPSSKSHSTVNESPEAVSMSWTYNSTPVPIPGHKPSAVITIDSTKVNNAFLEALEAYIYGSDGDGGSSAKIPLPDKIVEIAQKYPTGTTGTGS